ncbi:MAG TPA: hypothetical protein VNV66_03455, partial [Pilimelia sp.]|nr:hypothetical protein [Pilimelia sp.]
TPPLAAPVLPPPDGQPAVAPIAALAPPAETRRPAHEAPAEPPAFPVSPYLPPRPHGRGSDAGDGDGLRRDGYSRPAAPDRDGSRFGAEPSAGERFGDPPTPPDPPAGPPASPLDDAEALPQRVPAEPDVPLVPESPAQDPPANPPELARIATHLRRDDVPTPPRERPEGFDVQAVLGAVRGVAGVRDASLRATAAGGHSLRLDLADGADPVLVSREVARLLQERLGLAAAPQQPGQHPERPDAADPGSSWRGPAPGPTPGGHTRVGRRRAAAGGARGRAPVYADAPVAGGPPYAAAAPAGGGDPAHPPSAEATASRPLRPRGRPGPRVVIDHLQVSTSGLEATVEVRLSCGGQRAVGLARGPAVDGYVLRLCAAAAATAIDELLTQATPGDQGRCFVEHAAVVPFGSCEVAVVVVLLVCGGWVEQLAGSAVVAGDPRQAVVRAALAAVNRRLEALL